MQIQHVDLKELGEFSYQWPESVEYFTRGWEGRILVNSRRFQIKHGIGARFTYERQRVHTVTWINGKPRTEGVEVDDYKTSRCLTSILKRKDRKFVRTDDDIPEGYERFNIVNQLDEIAGSPRHDCLAVKILEDDVTSWTTHAVLRTLLFGDLAAKSKTRSKSEAEQARKLPSFPAHPNKRVIVEALLKYGQDLDTDPKNTELNFTSDPEANKLILTDPFAFLLGVIFDQGIPYERAWIAPYELKRRLGHLDPGRIASNPQAVATEIQRTPKLHRFVNTLPEWVISAARIVTEKYGGYAAAIWSDHPMARELQSRLDAFEGIGQKKAAMAVEILERDLKVPIRAMEGSDIAFDVHVRRVFLRTGLAEVDDMDHMVNIARELHPERPGALDDPAWRIGMQWCRPDNPRCNTCALAAVCPRFIYRADNVRGN